MSAAAAAFVGPDTPKDEKIRAARGEADLPPDNLGTILLILSRDPDLDVRTAARKSLRELPSEELLAMASSPQAHPLLLDLLARLHAGDRKLADVILSQPEAEPRTVEFLTAQGTEPSDVEVPDEDAAVAAEEGGGEDEEYLSKFKLLQHLSIGEKIKMAMTGDKEWRLLLIKETNKLVSTAVLKNPRLTDPEVLAIAKSIELNEEIIRLICMNKEWLKIYPIRKALVENSKTPLPKALRFLTTLNDKDIQALSKSRNISSVIAQQAQRLVRSKKR